MEVDFKTSEPTRPPGFMNRLTSLLLRVINLRSGVIYHIFFVLLAILISNAIISSMTKIHSYHLTDWGINYAGGFVRRGLVGEMLLWVSASFGWSFVWLAVSIAIISALGFLYLTARIFYPLRENHWAWFLIYTPFSFAAAAINRDIAGHKDHLLLLLAAAIFFVTATWKPGKLREFAIYFLLLLTAPLLLIHEGYVIYLPLLFLALTGLPLSPRVFTIGIVIGLLDIAIFLISATNAGDITHRDQMLAAFYSGLPFEWSLRPLDEYVAFFYIGQNFKEALEFTNERVLTGLKQLPGALAMTILPLLIFIWKIGPRLLFDNWSWSGRIAAILIALSLTAQIAILPVIVDWTRFFNMFLMLGSLSLATRLWMIKLSWKELPGTSNPSNAIGRYTLGWALVASLFLLKPGKFLPVVIKFETEDVLILLLITGIIFLSCQRGANLQRPEEARDSDAT